MGSGDTLRHHYALVNGKLTSIYEARELRRLPGAQALEILDVATRQPMRIRCGEKNQWHYAFMPGFSGESDIHKVAKALIQQVLIEACDGGRRPRVVNIARLNTLLHQLMETSFTVHLEYPLEGGGRADVALVLEGKVIFVIEVAHTHLTALDARSGHAWIEVDAGAVHADPYNLQAFNWSLAPKPAVAHESLVSVVGAPISAIIEAEHVTEPSESQAEVEHQTSDENLHRLQTIEAEIVAFEQQQIEHEQQEALLARKRAEQELEAERIRIRAINSEISRRHGEEVARKQELAMALVTVGALVAAAIFSPKETPHWTKTLGRWWRNITR